MQLLNYEDFEERVIKSKNPVIVDFYADWCHPCKLLTPILEKVSEEMKHIQFFKINVDESTNIAQQVGVMGLPCIIIFKNGEEVERLAGFQTEQQIRAKLTDVLE